MENEFLKIAAAFFAWTHPYQSGARKSTRRRPLLALMDVPAAGRAPLSFYAWRNRAETTTAVRHRKLSAMIKAGRVPAGRRRPDLPHDCCPTVIVSS